MGTLRLKLLSVHFFKKEFRISARLFHPTLNFLSPTKTRKFFVNVAPSTKNSLWHHYTMHGCPNEFILMIKKSSKISFHNFWIKLKCLRDLTPHGRRIGALRKLFFRIIPMWKHKLWVNLTFFGLVFKGINVYYVARQS